MSKEKNRGNKEFRKPKGGNTAKQPAKSDSDTPFVAKGNVRIK